MNRNALIAIALAAVLAGVATPIAAEPTAEPTAEAAPQDLARHMVEVGASLDRIASALDALLDGQRIDVMLKRIELADRRIEPLERAVRSARSEVDSIAEELRHMSAMREEMQVQFERRLDAGTGPGPGPDDPDRQLLQQIDREIELQKERLGNRERRVRELEDDLARGREAIEILDDTLADMLDR